MGAKGALDELWNWNRVVPLLGGLLGTRMFDSGLAWAGKLNRPWCGVGSCGWAMRWLREVLGQDQDALGVG